MKIAALVVAGGRGTRFGSENDTPKQYFLLRNKTVLQRTLECFVDHPAISTVQVVIHNDDLALYNQAISSLSSEKLLPAAFGGKTRQDSVFEGLKSLNNMGNCDSVMIHDAARPFVSAETIKTLAAAIAQGQAVIAAERVSDTVKQSDGQGRVLKTLPRDQLWRAQTPQAFPLKLILDAHEKAQAADRHDFTDDAAVAELADITVGIVEGNPENQKITTQADIAIAEQRLMTDGDQEDTAMAMETRLGNGFDVHKFAPGDHVWLGGVKIAHDQRLDGHSDADVVLHALTDAILGALCDGDIGDHFPPSDPQWKGAASYIFLEDAVKRVQNRGGAITNVDITILCEAPKIGPHRDAMRQRISEILRVSIDRVGVKATTTEGLGFTGRREGISAIATAAVKLPS